MLGECGVCACVCVCVCACVRHRHGLTLTYVCACHHLRPCKLHTFPTPKVRNPACLKRWGRDVNVGKIPGSPLTQFNRCPLRGSTGIGDGHGDKLWTESKSVHVLLAYVQALQLGVAPVHEVQHPPTPPLCCGSTSVHEESTLPTSCTPFRKVLSQRASRKLLKKFHTP